MEFEMFEYKCRFCLKISLNSMLSIFEKDLEIVDMFEACFGLTVCDNMDLPNFLCKYCYQQLKQSYEFYKQCLESIEILMFEMSSEAKDSLVVSNEYQAYNTNGTQQIESQNNVKTEMIMVKQEYTDLTYADDMSKDDGELFDNIDQFVNPLPEKPKIDIIQPDQIKKEKIKPKRIRIKKVCPVCGVLSINLKRHLVQHAAIKPYECDICGKRYRDKAHIQTHLDVHTNTRRFKCTECGKTFIHRWAFKLHVITQHTTERRYKCQYCGKLFGQPSALKCHYLHHTQIRNYKCEHCDKTFIRNNNLKRHIMIHTGERPYKCEICDFRFNQKGALKTHYKIHNR